jgi:RNA polymerase sigma-70 factor (ECF subfamily)
MMTPSSDSAMRPDSVQRENELQLVRQAQEGDGGAFARLVEPHISEAYHIALRITHNREDAEDASQQSFLNAYEHIDQFRGQSRFSTWLMRIAMNEALGRVRRRRSEDRRLSYQDSQGEEPNAIETMHASNALHPEVLYSQAENGRILREAIHTLDGTSRGVVWLLGLEERASKEAAAILKLSQAAVKTRFCRARRQLRECLAERM